MEKPDLIEMLDRPEIHHVLFYPEKMPESEKSDQKNYFFEVEPGVKIGCRFYKVDEKYPTILFFHGNGEISHDYDDIAPLYNKLKINLLVADYRGYGHSDGYPSVANIINDAVVLFTDVKKMLKNNGFMDKLFIMGRSLGSLCAIGIAAIDKSPAGLIVESGSATSFRNYLALHNLIPFNHPVWEENISFLNKEKIRMIKIPTLIMHAENDSLIPLSEAKINFNNSGAKDKKLVIIPRADHNTILYADRELYFNSLVEFIKANL